MSVQWMVWDVAAWAWVPAAPQDSRRARWIDPDEPGSRDHA